MCSKAVLDGHIAVWWWGGAAGDGGEGVGAASGE